MSLLYMVMFHLHLYRQILTLCVFVTDAPMYRVGEHLAVGKVYQFDVANAYHREYSVEATVLYFS